MKGYKTMDEKKMGRGRVAAISGIIAMLLIIVYIILCFAVDTEHMMPGTTINGIDLSGMTLEEAVDRLHDDEKSLCESAVLTVSLDGELYSVDVGDAIGFNYEILAEEAFGRSRAGLFVRGIYWINSLWVGYDKESPPIIKDSEALYGAVENSGLSCIDSTVQTSYKEENGQLLFLIGTAGEAVDTEKLVKEIIAAIQAKDYEKAIECPKTAGVVEKVDLEKVYQEIYVEAANATLDPENNYMIVNSVRGVRFDKDSAGAALDGAEEGSMVAVDLIYTEPEITTRNLQENLFGDVIGTYTTRVRGTANRLANIRLAVEKCNGAILLTDDVFSFNDTVGEQTKATGFQLAGAIDEGKAVQAYGGGICQVSSTIFAAALYANLEIVERGNHYYVSSYIPAGMDAAVAWGELDFQFANHMAYPIKLEITYDNGYLTVDILGTKMNKESVEIETEVVSSPGEPLEVLTYRKIYGPDGSQISAKQEAHSQYM